MFENIYKLAGVPVITVQLRYNGWVTEMQDPARAKDLSKARGIDNLLYRCGIVACNRGSGDRRRRRRRSCRGQHSGLTVLRILILRLWHCFCSSDVFFSCFADLALVSPVEYYKAGEGSLMQVVITPAQPYMPWTNEAIAKEADKQVCEHAYVHVTCVTSHPLLRHKSSLAIVE